MTDWGTLYRDHVDAVAALARSLGRTDGAPGPEWTGRQVSERAGLRVADVVAELESHVDAVCVSGPRLDDQPQPAGEA